jgi:4-aminobutyrate aminotransferase
LCENARQLGDYALERLRAMQRKHAVIGDVRGLGLLMGMELVKDRQTRERAIDLAEDVLYRALTKGLSFKLSMGNIITLSPPLNLTREQMDQALDILDVCLSDSVTATD